jgi:ferredoxin/protein involved in ribonucleotide reduction
MKTCYFTATGNSLYVARRIGGELLSIPKLMREGKIEIKDDVVGIVCPIYGGQMPKMVRAFMDKAKIEAGYVFFVYTYGTSYSVAKANAALAAGETKLSLDYVNAIRMVDNYLPGFEMKHQIETAGKKHIEEQIDKACRDISGRVVNVGGVGPVKKAGLSVVNGLIKGSILKDKTARKYRVSDACTRCGLCARVCPADNITVDSKVRFGDKCEVCYACLHICPKNAIHLRFERSSARFRNEHVSVKDIIAANERPETGSGR